MKKILIANRGEIAVRIIRACRELGIVAGRGLLRMRSDGAARALRRRGVRDRPERAARELPAHRRADRRARRNRAPTRVHPGYGFLAENEDFAAAVRDAGLTFIGPTPEAIETDGQQDRGADGGASAPACRSCPAPRSRSAPDVPDAEIAQAADGDRLSAAGEGGRRRRRQGHAHGRPTPADLAGAVRAARSEAGAAFGDAAVYLERRLTRPRHIEVQLLGDHHGTVLPFVERECSIQRRHQKVVEETPSLAVSPALRAAMTSAAAVGRQGGRLHQRRHDRVPARRGRPVLFPRDEHAAAGRASDHRDGDRRRSGALADSDRARRAARSRSERAADARTATRSSAASTPRIPTTTSCRRRAGFSSCACRPGPGIRDDSGATAGLDVPIFYDPMISKLVAWAEDRPLAIARMRRALGEYLVTGIKTTVPFFTLAARAAGLPGRPVPHHLSRRGAQGAQRPAVRRAVAGGRGGRGDRRGARRR